MDKSANPTSVQILKSLVARLGPPGVGSRSDVSMWISSLPEDQLENVSGEFLVVLGYEVEERWVSGEEAVFAITSCSEARDAIRLLAVSVLSAASVIRRLDVRAYEEQAKRQVAHVFAMRDNVQLVEVSRSANLRLWKSDDIVNLLLAILHSEFTLADFLYYPPAMRGERLADVAKTLGMTVEQLLGVDKSWRRFR